MTEKFTNPAPDKALGVPAAGTVDLQANDLEWQETGSEGFWLKPLFESPGNGLKMWLMKVDPGAFSPEHCHAEIEQIYVLEGSFYDQHKNYGPGAMIVRAPEAMHEAGSASGALMIVSYAPAR